MNQTLIPASTTFIATMGQICRIVLNAMSITQAMRLRTRKRRTRACSREKTRRAAWTQFTAGSRLRGCAGVALLGDLGADGVHVEPADAVDDLLQRARRQGAGLGEDEYAVAEGHQRGDRGDVGGLRKGLLRLGVDLAEDDVVVLLRGCLVDGRELPARATPLGPE